MVEAMYIRSLNNISFFNVVSLYHRWDAIGLNSCLYQLASDKVDFIIHRFCHNSKNLSVFLGKFTVQNNMLFIITIVSI